MISPERHADMLANRVRKNHRRLAAAFEREQVGAFRLYDWDIPEVRAVVDWYEGHLVVAEYERAQTREHPDYVHVLARAAGEALGVPEDRLHAKTRRTRPADGPRYERGSPAGAPARLVVRERALRFYADLDSYLDTGLFPDHRDTRRKIAAMSEGAAVLNLFGYTGTFTCWAAHGGAARTTTVDLSERYLAWARDNLELNGFDPGAHELVRSDVGAFLDRAGGERFDLIVVDPPSFSTRFGGGDLDVQRDHPALLTAVRGLLSDGGAVLFSTNHQRFEPRLAGLPYADCEEITAVTVPKDYRNRTVHRAFLLRARRAAVRGGSC